MEQLFVFGTLRDPHMLREAVGRTIAGIPAVLAGYKRRYVLHLDEPYPVLIPDKHHVVDGLLLAVTAKDLQRLDAYEDRVLYQRKQVTLTNGTKAWVYALRTTVDQNKLHFLPESSRQNKLFIVLSAVLLIFLFFVSIGPGYHVLSYLQNMIVSSPAQDFRIGLPDGRLILFSPTVYEQLQSIYLSQQTKEFSVCLQGKKEGTTYKITGLEVPKTYEQETFHVTAQLCDSTTLIALHSHPYQQCIFSDQDIAYYRKFAKVNVDGLIAVMCDRDRFGFYP